MRAGTPLPCHRAARYNRSCAIVKGGAFSVAAVCEIRTTLACVGLKRCVASRRALRRRLRGGRLWSARRRLRDGYETSREDHFSSSSRAKGAQHYRLAVGVRVSAARQ